MSIVNGSFNSQHSHIKLSHTYSSWKVIHYTLSSVGYLATTDVGGNNLLPNKNHNWDVGGSLDTPMLIGR